MQVSAACIRCMADRQEERIQRRTDLDEQIKAKYMKAVLRAIGESKDGTSAPELVEEISKVYESFFGKEQEYTKIKYEHNEKMMFAEQEIQSNIERAEDPLAQAILYARTGNYIDYGAMDVVDEGILKELIQKAAQETLDAENYHSFRQDLEQAKTLVYVTDNCGRSYWINCSSRRCKNNILPCRSQCLCGEERRSMMRRSRMQSRLV